MLTLFRGVTFTFLLKSKGSIEKCKCQGFLKIFREICFLAGLDGQFWPVSIPLGKFTLQNVDNWRKVR